MNKSLEKLRTEDKRTWPTDSQKFAKYLQSTGKEKLFVDSVIQGDEFCVSVLYGILDELAGDDGEQLPATKAEKADKAMVMANGQLSPDSKRETGLTEGTLYRRARDGRSSSSETELDADSDSTQDNTSENGMEDFGPFINWNWNRQVRIKELEKLSPDSKEKKIKEKVAQKKEETPAKVKRREKEAEMEAFNAIAGSLWIPNQKRELEMENLRLKEKEKVNAYVFNYA